MKKSVSISVALLIGLFWFSACSISTTSEGNEQGESPNEATESESENVFGQLSEGMQELEKALKEEGLDIEPVDHQVLQNLLPEEVGEIERTKAEGQKSGALGMKLSTATGHYRLAEENKSITINITDMGFLSGSLGAMSSAWLMAEIDQEGTDGYEKTTDYQGYRAFEKYSKKYNQAELSVLVANRFIVKVEGKGVGMETVLDAMDEVEMEKLEALKDEGTK